MTNAELDGNFVEIAGNTIYSAVNCNTTAGEWGASIPSVSCYYDGLTVSFWPNCVAGKSAGTCFEINTLGAKNIIRSGSNTCNLTTHYHCTNLIFLRYEAASDKWRVHADYNSTDDYRIRWNSYVTVNNSAGSGVAVHGYQLLMEGIDGKFYPVTEGGSTGNTNAVSTAEMRVGGTILMYENGTDRNANTTTPWGVLYSAIYNSSMEYWNNRDAGWATTYMPVYLVATKNSNGNFVLDNTSYTSFLTQDLPTSDDGKYYIKIGIMNDDYDNLQIENNHPIYVYKDGMVREWGGYANNADKLDNFSAADFARIGATNTFSEKQTYTSDVNICGQNGTATCAHILNFGQESDLGCNQLAGGAQIGLGANAVQFSNPIRYAGNLHICHQAGICLGKCDSDESGGCFAFMVENTGSSSYAWHRVRGWQSGTPGYTTFSAPSCSDSAYGFETPKGLISCDRLHVDGCGCATSTCYFSAPILCANTYACIGEITLFNNMVSTVNTPLCLYSNCAVSLNKACINDYCLPASDGSAGQFVCTDGNGNLAFGNVSGGGSSLSVEDEGSLLSTAATTINFVGKNVTASGTGTTKTVCAHGDTVCITSGCTYEAHTIAFALSNGWQSAELMFQADTRTPVCYSPSEPRLEIVQLRSYSNCCVVFDYNANTTNNSSGGCRTCSNTTDIFPDVYIADETVLRYYFWKVPMGSSNTCSRIYFEASYVGGSSAYNSSTARCDRVFLSGRSDTIITPTCDSGWCIYFDAGQHYITRSGSYYLCSSSMRCAEWALKVIT
jgi:hypothetical protein